MDTQVIAERLRERLQPLRLREIGEAAGLDAAMNGTVAPPSVFVVPMRETPVRIGDDEVCDGAPRFRQFGFVIVVENVRDFKGGEQLAPLATIRAAIGEAMQSWSPFRGATPMRFVGGQIVNFNGDGRLWWSDEYGYQYFG